MGMSTSNVAPASEPSTAPARESNRRDWNWESLKDRNAKGLDGFDLVTVSGATNERLRAQAGVFLVHRVLLDRLPNHLPFEPWEDQLGSRLTKYTLKAAEGPTLIALLKQEGITWASLYPGMPGATKEVMERNGLSRPKWLHA